MNLKQKIWTAIAVIVLCWAAVIILKASLTIALTVTAVIVALRVIDYFTDITIIDRILEIEFSETLQEAKQRARKWLES